MCRAPHTHKGAETSSTGSNKSGSHSSAHRSCSTFATTAVTNAASDSTAPAPPPPGEAELRAGIDQLKACGATSHAALTQEHPGDRPVTHGRQEEGRSLLTGVRSTSADLGAVRWLARVDALRVAGVAESA
jgi:hypothetical protein